MKERKFSVGKGKSIQKKREPWKGEKKPGGGEKKGEKSRDTEKEARDWVHPLRDHSLFSLVQLGR